MEKISTESPTTSSLRLLDLQSMDPQDANVLYYQFLWPVFRQDYQALNWQELQNVTFIRRCCRWLLICVWWTLSNNGESLWQYIKIFTWFKQSLNTRSCNHLCISHLLIIVLWCCDIPLSYLQSKFFSFLIPKKLHGSRYLVTLSIIKQQMHIYEISTLGLGEKKGKGTWRGPSNFFCRSVEQKS